MKRAKTMAKLAVAVSLLALSGCAQSQPMQMANEIVLPLDGVTEVRISYDEETVTFREGRDGVLVVREYMTEDARAYHAKVSQSGGTIQIREGGKPLFHGNFSRWVEVYLPASYRGSLTVTTTSGAIDVSELRLSLEALRVDSTSGAVSLDDVEAQSIHLSSTRGEVDANALRADTLRLETTSGSMRCAQLQGNVNFTTTSGSLRVESAAGAGSYRAENAGEMDVTCTEVTGALSFYNKNGSIRLTLPGDLDFEFEGVAKNGSIETSFSDCVALDGGTLRGTVGSSPAATVRVETKNGSIAVNR